MRIPTPFQSERDEVDQGTKLHLPPELDDQKTWQITWKESENIQKGSSGPVFSQSRTQGANRFSEY